VKWGTPECAKFAHEGGSGITKKGKKTSFPAGYLAEVFKASGSTMRTGERDVPAEFTARH